MSEKRRYRYRKVASRMWADERFLQLSRPQANAQTLWVYLMTGPHTTAIPGLFTAGEARLSEELGWSLREFRRCFQEIVSLGMAQADWQRRVVWLPKAVRYNEPESPNVVKAWRSALDEIPECPLKYVAAQAIKDFVQGLAEGFRKALGEGWPDADEKALLEALGNQEQEQEQEQTKSGSSAPPNGAEPPGAVLVFDTVGPQRRWWLTEAHIAEWQAAYSTLDVRAETKRAHAWLRANPSKRKTAVGMPRFFVNWLSRAVERPRPQVESRGTVVPDAEATKALLSGGRK